MFVERVHGVVAYKRVRVKVLVEVFDLERVLEIVNQLFFLDLPCLVVHLLGGIGVTDLEYGVDNLLLGGPDLLGGGLYLLIIIAMGTYPILLLFGLLLHVIVIFHSIEP